MAKNTKLPKVSKTDKEQAKLVKMSSSAIDNLEKYIKEVEISNKNFLSKGFTIFKSEYLKTELIKRRSDAILDKNYEPLKEISQDLSNYMDKLAKDMEALKSHNIGKAKLQYNQDSWFFKKYQALTKPLEDLSKATKVVDDPQPTGAPKVQPSVNPSAGGLDAKQLLFIDRLSTAITDKLTPVLVKVGPTVPSKPEKTPEEQEETRKRNSFYDKFSAFFGFKKTEDSLNSSKTGGAVKKTDPKQAVQKTAGFIKSALDNILDLPEVLGRILFGFVGKATGLFATGLSYALIGLKKVVFSKFGMIGTIGALLFTDTFKGLLKDTIASLFGKKTAEDISGAIDSGALGSALIGAGIGGKVGAMIGTAIGGPVGAVVGGILGLAVGGIGGMLTSWAADGTLNEKINLFRDALGISFKSLDTKIEELKKSKEETQTQLDTQVNEIASLQGKMKSALYESDAAYRQYIDKQLLMATEKKNTLTDQLAMANAEQERHQNDLKIIKENGWFGELVVLVGKAQDKLNNLFIQGITFGYISSTDQLAAITERKLEDAKTVITEKIEMVKGWIDTIIALPGKIIDMIGEKIKDASNQFEDWIYKNTVGWFTGKDKADKRLSETGAIGFDPSLQAKGAQPPKFADLLNSNPYALPADGRDAAKNVEGSQRIKELEMRLEENRERRRSEELSKLSIINAPANSSTTIQNNKNNTVHIRPSPIDSKFKFGGF